MGATGAGPAAAAPVSRTLNYTCSLQSVSQHAAVTIDADVTRSAVVGKPTRRFAIHARSRVSGAGTSGLNWIGVKTVEGRVDARVHVTAPRDDAEVVVPFTVPRTSVPESGPFDVKGAGYAPARTFHHPGKAKITVGDLTLHVVPKDADGKVNPGETEVPCTLDPGQNAVLASFDITRSKAPSGSTPSGNNDGNSGGSDGTAPAGTARPGTSEGAGSANDGTRRPPASGSDNGSDPADAAHGARDPARHSDDSAKGNGTTPGSAARSDDPTDDPSVHAAPTADQDSSTPVLLTAGAVTVGAALLVALAIAFRIRKDAR
ncbi:DUF6801 domain-containing protein [Streptomyces sp. NPDC000151]|uniref:DUF6801 domain-containing protein n=1 Tax=Streptomyces sp. NPDC000151 TaxID=3154244 RepID=UPI00331C1D81